jgi:hypothetical protein
VVFNILLYIHVNAPNVLLKDSSSAAMQQLCNHHFSRLKNLCLQNPDGENQSKNIEETSGSSLSNTSYTSSSTILTFQRVLTCQYSRLSGNEKTLFPLSVVCSGGDDNSADFTSSSSSSNLKGHKLLLDDCSKVLRALSSLGSPEISEFTVQSDNDNNDGGFVSKSLGKDNKSKASSLHLKYLLLLLQCLLFIL